MRKELPVQRYVIVVMVTRGVVMVTRGVVMVTRGNVLITRCVIMATRVNFLHFCRIYEEVKNMNQIDFDYMENEDPYDKVEDLCDNMTVNCKAHFGANVI